MAGTIQSGMPCSEFEALLSDALDGVLAAPALQRFEQHKESCALCRVMFAEAQAGMNWLEGLQEVEPPAHLVNRILAATSGIEEAHAPEAAAAGWGARVRGWFGPALQPRFAMSFAMAFFSVSLVLNMAGVHLGEVRSADLRPGALMNSVVSTYEQTQGRVVHYYENLRFVYEIESRVRQLKNATEQNAAPANDNKPRKNNNDTSGQPPRQEEHYSLTFEEGILASVAAPIYDDAILAVLDRRHQ